MIDVEIKRLDVRIAHLNAMLDAKLPDIHKSVDGFIRQAPFAGIYWKCIEDTEYGLISMMYSDEELRHGAIVDTPCDAVIDDQWYGLIGELLDSAIRDKERFMGYGVLPIKVVGKAVIPESKVLTEATS